MGEKKRQDGEGEGALLLNLDSNVHLVLFHILQEKKIVRHTSKS